jgi:hypothetical protein
MKAVPNHRGDFEKIKEIIADAETDADKFFSAGNKAAGTRLRKKMLEVKYLTDSVRKTVSKIKAE